MMNLHVYMCGYSCQKQICEYVALISLLWIFELANAEHVDVFS